MVRPVSLSNPAFAALRKEKRDGESDSDVVLRLLREARQKRRDPEAFLSFRGEPLMKWDAYEKVLDEMRAADAFGGPRARS